jgi:hypothetical protein
MGAAAGVKLESVEVVFSAKRFEAGESGLWPRVTMSSGGRPRTFSMTCFSANTSVKSLTQKLLAGADIVEVIRCVCMTAYGKAAPLRGEQSEVAAKAQAVLKLLHARVKTARDGKLANRIERARADAARRQLGKRLKFVFDSLPTEQRAVRPQEVQKIWRQLQGDAAVAFVMKE